MAAMTLSILIASLRGRYEKLNGLLAVLQPQLTDETELIICASGPEETVGAKRQRLKDMAIGQYLCYIDDDDMVSDDYVEQIISAIRLFHQPDCIGFRGTLESPNGKVCQVKYSITNRDKNHREGDTFNCFVGHLTPIRRDLIEDIEFKDLRHGEDAEFCTAVRQRCEREGFVDAVLYRYLTQYNV